jgi:hypothetical protein
MKKHILVSLFTLALVPVAANAEITWTGGAGVRHLIRKNDDGLATRNANGQDTSKSTVKNHQLRGDLNASSKSDSLDWGIGVRTLSSATSEWVSFQNNGDLAIGLENAYLRPHTEVFGGEGSVTIGRARTVFLYDSLAQGFFDKDNRFDGLGWSWKMDNFGLNVSQYALGARNSGVWGATTYTTTQATENSPTTQGGFGMLYSFQPHAKFKLSDEMDAMVAVGYHMWQGTGGAYTNAVHGGTAGTVGNVNPVIMDNARQFQVLTEWNFPMKLRFVGEYVQNKDVNYGTRTAGTDTGRDAQTGMLALSLAYGKPKKASEWSLSYSYVRKGIASVINTFTNGNMPADNIGHLVDAKYMLADGLSLGAKVELYREKAMLAGDGLAIAAPNQNRKQSQDRFEFTAAAAF